MDQLKQHFEKGILAIAMLVMGYVAFTLYMDADEVQTKIQDQQNERLRGGTKSELGKIDMKPYTGALAKLEDTKPLTLSNPHNLFNPVQWRRTPQGTVFKVEKGTETAGSNWKMGLSFLRYEFRGPRMSGGAWEIDLRRKGIKLGRRRYDSFWASSVPFTSAPS